jgi:hypothetical protein
MGNDCPLRVWEWNRDGEGSACKLCRQSDKMPREPGPEYLIITIKMGAGL